MVDLRGEFVRQLAAANARRDFSCIARQHGMFSLLGIDPTQVRAMRVAHHIYMMEDSRINIAGLHAGNLGHVAGALAQVLRESA